MQPIAGIEDVEAGLAALLAEDPSLAEVAAIAGPLPLRLSEPGFAGLAHIVVAQMVSRASADAIWGRLVIASGGAVSAGRYLELGPEHLQGVGLSRAKASTLVGLAAAVTAGDLDLEALARAPAETAIGALTAMPGIGPWTAEVYLMFCGGHPDVFPAGDVALRIAVGRALGHDVRPEIADVRAIAQRWAPWRSVAARLFWAYYARHTGRDATPQSG